MLIQTIVSTTTLTEVSINIVGGAVHTILPPWERFCCVAPIIVGAIEVITRSTVVLENLFWVFSCPAIKQQQQNNTIIPDEKVRMIAQLGRTEEELV